MKMSHMSVISTTALIMACQSVNAESLFRPRASLGFAAYDLSIADATDVSITSTYMTLGAGATLSMDQLYFDAAVSTSLSADFEDNTVADEDGFSRQDIALAVGMALDGGLSIFGGYKTGSSEYKYVTNSLTDTFTAKGLFGGASYSMPMGQNSFSVSAALALMNGELEETETGFLPLIIESDTVGLSLSMTYTMNFSETNGLILKGAYQGYNFSDWTLDGASIPGLSDITETIVSAEAAYFVNF